MKAAFALATGVAAIGVTLGAVGLKIAKKVTAPVSDRIYDLTIRKVDDSRDRRVVVLDRTQRTNEVGNYSLLMGAGRIVRLSDAVEDRGPGLVGREVLSDPGFELEAGMLGSWSGINYLSPADAGLESSDVDVTTVAGPAPAWLVTSRIESTNNDWAIHIHGLGSPRAGTLRGAQVAADAGLTSLVVSYRNDGEGPTVGAGRSELGSVEADDVRAAVRFALDRGAVRVVLFGWSMGGAIALQIADDPEFRGVITGLVLESPVLDWVSTIKANCVRAGFPAWAGQLAIPWLSVRLLSRLTGLRSSVELSSFDWIARAEELTLPTLVLHGRNDSSAPHEASSRLRALRPDRVELELFDADHTMSWNSDPERWRSTVSAWLASLSAAGQFTAKQ